jgi:hypothetical protein
MGGNAQAGFACRVERCNCSAKSRENFMSLGKLKLGHRLTKVDALPGFRVRLTYTDGYVGELDFWPYIEWGEAVAPLKNSELFATAHVGCGGSSLEWIGPDGSEIDFCADALRMDLEGLRARPSRPSAAE